MIGFVKAVFGVLNMPCREHTVLFSRQLDETLPRGVAAGLRLHIVYCGGCRKFRAQIRALRELAGLIGRELDSAEPMPQGVRERVLARVHRDSNKNRD